MTTWAFANLLPGVSTLPNLVAISLVKVQIFQIAKWPHVGHVIKPVTVSQHLA